MESLKATLDALSAANEDKAAATAKATDTRAAAVDAGWAALEAIDVQRKAEADFAAVHRVLNNMPDIDERKKEYWLRYDKLGREVVALREPEAAAKAKAAAAKAAAEEASAQLLKAQQVEKDAFDRYTKHLWGEE